MSVRGPTPPFPKKRLGQHFLVDPNMTRKILATAELNPTNTVLEIGPGRGALTRSLCESVAHVVAVEIDPRLVSYLEETMGAYANLEIHCGDALQYPYQTLPPDCIVVANLPYYISTPLLFRLFEARDHFQRMVLMLQTEVAKRLVARPRTREYGALSVMIQYLADVRIAFKIPPTCFRPRPDVGSAVVRLDVRPEVSFTREEEARFAQTVRVAFSHRRKTLANSFRDADYVLSDVEVACRKAHIEPSRRAESLTIEEFKALTQALG